MRNGVETMGYLSNVFGNRNHIPHHPTFSREVLSRPGGLVSCGGVGEVVGHAIRR